MTKKFHVLHDKRKKCEMMKQTSHHEKKKQSKEFKEPKNHNQFLFQSTEFKTMDGEEKNEN
jgi:hypothetical protein